MARRNICCVGDCNATSDSHNLYCMPRNEKFRNLWMSFLVPTNPLLIGLSKEQIMRKRVCQKHFERNQMNGVGGRTRYSYPCLFSAKEIAHGTPLDSGEHHALSDHNYYQQEDEDIDDNTETSLVIGNADLQNDHEYSFQFSENQNEDVKPQRTPKIRGVTPTTVCKPEGGDAFADDVENSPLLSPPREDLLTLELPPKDVNGVFSRTTTMGQEVVSPVPYPMNKPNTGPFNRLTNNKRIGIMPKCNNLPACCQTIYEKCKATIVKLRRQLQAALNTTAAKANKRSFEFVTSWMPSPVRTFVRMQADIVTRRRKQAYRFREEQKLLCLALYTSNPAAYKFMSTVFMLPHKRTLCKFGLSVKDRADKAAKPAQRTDATDTSQEDVKPITTADVSERGPTMPISDATEVSDAVAPPALPTNPCHAELMADLKRCLPAPPKLPSDGAVPKDEHGMLRRPQRPQRKTTLVRKQPTRDVTIRVFKLAEGTTCEDVAAHVSSIVPHYLVRCRRMLTKLKGPAFVVEVPKEHREAVLDPSFWPEGVVTWARGTGLPLPQKMLKIRVFNVAEGTAVSEMVRHVCRVVPEDKVSCERIGSKGGGESFKVAMPRRYLRLVAAPSFWPAGVGVARMRTQQNPRKKRVKNEYPTDLDPVEDNASKIVIPVEKFSPNAYIIS